MAPPPVKRRKLSHSDSSNDDGSFSLDRFANGAAELDNKADADTNTSDELVDEGANLEEDEDMQWEIDEEFEDEEEEGSNADAEEDLKVTNTPRNEAKEHRKQAKGRDEIMLDGVYTAEVYKSSLFKLQVDELLKQVKLKYGKKEAPVENAMRNLKRLIEQIPTREPQLIVEAQKSLKIEKIVIPFPNPQPPKDAKYKFSYERPTNINATGSYPLKTATRSGEELAVDLVVTMPASIFQEKDYLNHRYFYKRAYYLACIAAGIKASKASEYKLSFSYLNGNHLQPIIIVHPSGNGGLEDFTAAKSRIHIIVAVPENTFASTKLLPDANCIRSKGLEEETSTKSLSPTPFYNSSLQADASITAYLKLLHASSSQCDAYRDACILGRIWLRQRGFESAIRKGGFGNFEWAALIALLLQKNPGAGASALSTSYSSYQLFKATLQFLANRDLFKQPYKFHASNTILPKNGAVPTFFDGMRNLNILFKMTPWSYALLRDEAQISVKMLADSTFDQFESTFILKADPIPYRYDAVLQIPFSSLYPETDNQNIHFGLIRKLYGALVRALTDRITSMSVRLPDEKDWSIGSGRTLTATDENVLISFGTDPATANRTVDHGPSAEDKKEAASFRQFWGEKAELRRFKDGSILESVVWSAKDSTTSILEQIVLYIIQRHMPEVIATNARFVGDSISRLISSGRVIGQSGTTAFQPLMNAFVSLEREIRDLEGVPLQIRQILAADPQLRYSSVRIPFTATDPKSQPASIAIQFEGSGRWPDDLSAVQRTKIAFLLKISELLTGSNPKVTTRIGLENPSQPSQNQAYLDIVLSTGPSFRLRIHHDREATLLDRQLKDKTLDGSSRESAALALAAYKRDFLRTPTHTQAIQSLSTRYPALSPAIRLTKKWFASHLLAMHFADEFIELLVVRIFLQPHPWPVPACATTGFLRTLFWISRWDWRHVPLVVDFAAANPEQGTMMKSEDVDAIMKRFEAWRRIDPALNRVVLFAASNLDNEGTTWTDKGRPERVVAGRMTALARAAVGVMKEEDIRLGSIRNGDVKGDSSFVGAFIPETLFATSMTDYDFIIHLTSRFTSKGKTKKDANSGFKNLELQISSQSRGANLAGYDPVALFVEDLKAMYGNSILWFRDEDGGDVVAGLWNPAVTARRGWKVKVGYSSMPVKAKKSKRDIVKDNDGVDVEVNKAGIYAEIARLGGGMVQRIEVLKT